MDELQDVYRRLRVDEEPAEPLLAERDRLKLKIKSNAHLD